MNLDLSKIAYKKLETHPNQPWLIFLHDSLGCVELWRDFPEQLQQKTGLNVLVYDRQGYGKSPAFSYQQRGLGYMEIEATILVQLLAYWKIEKPILFGHSDGGTIAMIFAGMFPDHVRGIITEGAHIFVEEVTLKGIQEVVEQYKNTNLKQKLTKYHGELTNNLFWAWASTWNSPYFKNWNCLQFLPLISSPALIIQGEEDEFGSLEQVHQALKFIGTNASSLILPAVKHSPHKEVPDLILENSMNFIKKQLL